MRKDNQPAQALKNGTGMNLVTRMIRIILMFLIIIQISCLSTSKQTPFKDNANQVIMVGDTILYPDFDIGSETHYRHEGVMYYDVFSNEYYLDSQNTVEIDEIDWHMVEIIR